MTYTPENLKLWTLPEYYAGEEFPEYYVTAGQSRDSDALERSNFACMLRELGGESDTVIVVRAGHWAVGWVEFIGVHKSDDKALEIADEIAGALEDYPVIDEEHWSELEREDADQTWANCYDDRERIAYIRKYRDQFEFHDYADLMAVARGRYFSGYASELLH